MVVSAADNKSYKIIAKHSGKRLDVYNASRDSAAQVVQVTNTRRDKGQWDLIQVIATGINNTNKSNTSLGPNPSSDVFKLSFGEPVSSIKVMNILGVEVYSNYFIDADITFGSSFAPGIYVTLITYKSGVLETKTIRKD